MKCNPAVRNRIGPRRLALEVAMGVGLGRLLRTFTPLGEGLSGATRKPQVSALMFLLFPTVVYALMRSNIRLTHTPQYRAIMAG